MSHTTLSLKCRTVLTALVATAAVTVMTGVSAHADSTIAAPQASSAQTVGASNTTATLSTAAATQNAASVSADSATQPSSAVALAAVSAAVVTPTSSDVTEQVQILGINDLHGYLATTTTATLPGSAAIKGAGTAPLLAGYLDSATSSFLAANPGAASFRVEAGDMISASPAESALLYDQSTEAVLNAMGIQAGTLGNHEFDKGLTQLNEILQGINPHPGENAVADQFYQKYTQQQLAGNYDMVISNVVNKSDGKIPNGWKPYTILSENTPDGVVKIGVIGVITTDTPSIVLADEVAPYTFLDPATTIAKYSAELQAQGVNAIVVLGHTASDNVAGADSQVVGETADIITKLDQIDPNNSVDLYVAGHSHTFTNGTVNGVRVVQALAKGEAFDNVTGTYNFKTNDFVSTPNAQIIAVAPSNGVTPNSSVAAIVSVAKGLTDQIAQQPIGQFAQGTTISRAANSIGESPLGTLVTQAQYETAQQKGFNVVAAITNNGGIRNDLNANASGDVTWGAAQSVQPFGNVIEIVTLTGQQIVDLLNQQTFGNKTPGADQFFLQEYGLNYTVTDNPNTADLAHPYVVVPTSLTTLSGAALSLTKSYQIAVNNFIAGGGDGFTELVGKPMVAGFEMSDTDLFIAYLKSFASKNQKIPTTFAAEKTYVKNGFAKPVSPAKPSTPSIAATANKSTVAAVPENKVSVKRINYAVKTTEKALPKTSDTSTDGAFLAGLLLLGSTTIVGIARRKTHGK
ncbi:MAG: bifunctional metallophosphatase/5'-nucleotidase [Streptococcaceae bacterium]|jgi:5'-nucleotidase|nr:bifunctional metallophosphatase/5'-nucleotidase [Streptococcaceae bacterium]